MGFACHLKCFVLFLLIQFVQCLFAFCEARRKPVGMLKGAPANGSSEVSSFSSCGRAAVVLVVGPFKEIDDEDV